MAERLRTLRAHGSKKKYFHEILGTNSRLDALQAAILRVKLKHLDSWAEGRKANADRYRELLANEVFQGLIACPPAPTSTYRHVYNQFTIKSAKRDSMRDFLKQAGIPTEIYYPLCLHLQPSFAYLGHTKGTYPVAETASMEVLSLPVYPELSKVQQEAVVCAIANFCTSQR